MTPREAIGELVIEYGMLIDEDRLEDWLELFCEACTYVVMPRENIAQNLPLPLILCENKDMLRDRVTAYRKVNEYNFHYDRHVIGGVRFRGETDGLWRIEASYSLFQTDLEGVSRLFLVGNYEMTIAFEDGTPRLRDVTAIVDTASVPTLLATPV